MMLKPKNDVKNSCQVNVYLCEQNRSLSSLKGSLKQRHFSAKSNDKWSLECQGKPPKRTSSLEKLMLNAQQLSALSPSKSLLSSHNLSPWCSLKDLNAISNSNLSINNNYDSTSRDCLGSVNNLDTVSPRLSSNSLNSFHLDYPDLNDPTIEPPPLGSYSNVQLPAMQQHHINFIYPQQSSRPNAINKYKSAPKFSRSTSCPQVIPPMQLKELQITPKAEKEFELTTDQAEPILGKVSPAPPESAKTPVNPDPNPSIGSIPAEGQGASKGLKKELSKDGERRKRCMMASKSLARSKCMQWLNSLDEGD